MVTSPDAAVASAPVRRPRGDRSATAFRLLHDRRVGDGVFVVGLVGFFVARFAIAYALEAPTGFDGGDWLALGRGLVGTDVRPPGLVFTPAVPLLVWVSVTLLGPTVAFALVAAAGSVAPSAGLYLLLRDQGVGWPGAALALTLAAASSTGEVAAWGGYPQLFAIGLALAFLWRLDRALRTGGWRPYLLAGGLLALTMLTSDFVAWFAFGSGGLVVVLTLVFWRARSPRPVRHVARGLAVMALPCVPLVPLYARLAATRVDLVLNQPEADRVPRTALSDTIEFLYRDFPTFWRALFLLALITPLLLLNRRRTPLWIAAASTAAVAGLGFFVFRELRLVYFLPPAVLLCVACWLQEFDELPGRKADWFRYGAVGLLVMGLVIQTVSGLRLFSVQRDHYAAMTPELMEAMEWVESQTPPDAVLVVTPFRDGPLGWWVEGLGNRQTLAASDPRWLHFASEKDRAAKAALVFAQRFPTTDTLQRAANFGASYVFVDKRWHKYPGRSKSFQAREPDAVAFENEGVVVYRAPASP